ncbi:hypothetical protein ACJIZ3_009938 [Penstemon smallii]|uniref:PWWP domain-containing protein n=1 Tax=Penstemon smallii TaxID=265156 RepID=A0ABD3TDX0_9LAMI
MENKKTSETLEKDDSGLFCNSSGGKLTSEVIDRRVKESLMFDGVTDNNNINTGSLDINPDNKSFVVTKNDKVENNDVPVFEGDLKFSWNDEVIQVDGSGEKGDDVLHSHVPGSPTTLEVSGNSINLFVEVFGPLDGMYESINDENASAKNEDVDVVEGQECKFKVGDLVWVKTRTELWWPGMISDPCNPAKDAIESQKNGSFSFLVKYFGNANFVWCLNADLRPFLECFEQMSGQNDSRSFFGAVEKALSVIGRRVKSKLTCPCFSKESQTLSFLSSSEDKEESLTSMDTVNNSDVLSLSQFEPVNFVSCIRNLASTGSVPGKIELTVMKNCLSAYYCSIGHHELPLRLLRPCSEESRTLEKGCDDNLLVPKREKRSLMNDPSPVLDNKITSSGTKGFESRERKKSKYLSYPYVDVKNVLKDAASTLGEETETETENLKHDSSTTAKSTPQGTKSRKRGSKKPLKQHHVVNKGDNIDACSTELLNELRSSALDCCYLNKSKYSDTLKRFYCSYRIFSFLDVDIADQQISESKKKRIGGVKESEKQKVNPESGDNLLAKGDVTHKRAKKKKEKVKSEGVESISDSFVTGVNITPSNPSVISFQQTCSDLPKSQTSPEKRNEGATQVLPPDLNGNQSIYSVEKPLMEGVVTPNINVSTDKIKVVASIPSLENIPQSNNGVGVNGTGQIWSTKSISKESGSNMINFGQDSSVQNSVHIGLSPPTGKPERKKRKRKEMTSEIPSVNIPDLNGNVSPGENLMSPDSEGKPQLKRMRNKSNTDKINKVVEDVGGGLILNFAPDIPLPPKETLISTFSRFGLLKETQIQILNGSSAEILYQRSSDARFAFRSLEKNNPFGESIVSFNLNGVPVSPPRIKKKRKYSQVPKTFVPVDASKNVAKPALDLASMRQNVEMMKSTLEKEGANLSPEMRSKLENEIEAFLNKIGNVGGSSSSS